MLENQPENRCGQGAYGSLQKNGRLGCTRLLALERQYPRTVKKGNPSEGRCSGILSIKPKVAAAFCTLKTEERRKSRRDACVKEVVPFVELHRLGSDGRKY